MSRCRARIDDRNLRIAGALVVLLIAALIALIATSGKAHAEVRTPDGASHRDRTPRAHVLRPSTAFRSACAWLRRVGYLQAEREWRSGRWAAVPGPV